MKDLSVRPEQTSAEETSHADTATGLFLVAVSVFALLWLIPQNTLPSASEHDISPDFFPSLAAWTVLLLSLLFVVIRLRRFRRLAKAERSLVVFVEVVVWAVAGGITVLGLSTVGFLATAAILTAVWMFIGGSRTWWHLLLLATLFPLAVEQIAWIVFTVRLP
ncbi:tripartite tricarboxylate transporter TctB family protein [Pelagibius sp. Alg239-R121]|uniref:tripartite tricarboxylate transporter TctB family protein n=1 Tax=Pelagibius sp. Alg239-R121 TaxID=2993448 RepID=UPI0024A6750D|nr:tripartite tricarboxylate transporter TctB family protein [Pelagibius sp. Alg239-R121]